MMRESLEITRLLSDPNRIRILKLLENRELCVCHLTRIINIKQPSISRHLKVLQKAGIISTRQNGLWTFAKLDFKNQKAKILYSCLSMWVDEDEIIIDDRKKIKEEGHDELCNKNV